MTNPVLDPASVLTAGELAAAHAAAQAAPLLAAWQRDILSDIFGPTLSEMHQRAQAA